MYLVDIDAFTSEELTILNLQGTPITDRLYTLAALRQGSGVTVLTSPMGAKWWTLVSPQVEVRVIPDGYEYVTRCNEHEWAIRNTAVSEKEVKGLLSRTNPPSRGSLVVPWNTAQSLLASLPVGVAPIIQGAQGSIEEKFPVLSTYSALDGEWGIEDKVVSGIAISNADRNYYVPLRARDKILSLREVSEVRKAFSTALEQGLPCVFHNGRSDLNIIYDGDPINLYGKPIDDTLLMAFLIDPESQSLGLKSLVPRYLDKRAIPYPGNVEELTVEEAARYAAGSDTRHTFDLRRVLAAKLIEQGQWGLYTQFQRPLVPIVASMEKYGVPVSIPDVLRMYRDTVAIEQGMRRTFIDRGYDIHKDVEARRLLTDALGYDPGTLDQRIISKYENGIVDLVLLHRRSRTRRRNFLAKILKGWNSEGRPDEYRIYPQYNQAGKDSGGADFGRAPRTGRFSSSGPNFQQQPRDIRKLFVPPTKFKWFKYDYSQLELRLAANISGDHTLIADILSGDPHEAFRYSIEQRTRRDIGRPTAKTANFEKLYFGGDAQLVQILQKERVFIGLDVAKEIGIAHASRYGEYYDYGDETVRSTISRNGEVRTKNGRLRSVKEVLSSDPERFSYGRRAVVNHTIQGWAADIVKKMMIDIVPVLQKYGAHLAITVHDEIDGWVPEDVDLVAFDKEVKEIMEGYDVGPVPLLVDGGVRSTWGG